MAFFRNDIVCYLDHKHENIIYGIVQSDLKIPQNSQNFHQNTTNPHKESSDNAGSQTDNYISEYPADYTFPQENEVNVKWMRLQNWTAYETSLSPAPSPCPAAQLSLVDRHHFVRDIVRDAETQSMGLILRTHAKLHVQVIGWNAVLLNINRSRLETSVPCDPSIQCNMVQYKGIVGHVADHELHYILRFSDGARIRVHETAVTWFKLCDKDAVDRVSDDEFYENAVIKGDARSLIFYTPNSVIESYSDEETGGRANKFLPIFLTETRRHNALFLSRLRKRTCVTVLVEKRIVVAAKFFRANSSSSDATKTKLLAPELKYLVPLHPRPWEFTKLRDVLQYTIRPEDKIHNTNILPDLESIFYQDVTEKTIQSVHETAPEVLSALVTDSNFSVSKTNGNSWSRIATPLYIQRILFRRHRPRYILNPLRKLRQLHRCKAFRSGHTRLFAPYTESDSEDDVSVQLPSSTSSYVAANQGESTADLRVHPVELPVDHVLPECEFPRRPLIPGTRVPVVIVSTKTTYDVMWQNGVFESCVLAQRLRPEYLAPDEHLFMPGDLIRLKSEMKSLTHGQQENSVENTMKLHDEEEAKEESEHSFGIISSVNSKEMLCTVRWFRKHATASGIKMLLPKGPSEEAGVYEVVSLPKTRYYVGDCVTALVEDESGTHREVSGYVEDVECSTGCLTLLNGSGEKIKISLMQCIESVMEDGYGSDSIDDSSTIDLDRTSTSFYDELYNRSEEEDDSLEVERRVAFGGAENDLDDEYESSDDWKTVDEGEQDSDIEALEDTFNHFWICNSLFLKKIFLQLDTLAVNAQVIAFLLDVASVKVPPFAKEDEGHVVSLARLMHTPLFPSHWTLENQLMWLGSTLDLVESSYRIVYCDQRDFRLRRLFKMVVKLKRWVRQHDNRSELFRCCCPSAATHSMQLEENSGGISARVIEHLTVTDSCSVDSQMSQLFPNEVSWPLAQKSACAYDFIRKLVNSINDIHTLYAGWMAENADNLVEVPLPSEKQVTTVDIKFTEDRIIPADSTIKMGDQPPLENGEMKTTTADAEVDKRNGNEENGLSSELDDLCSSINEIPEEQRGVFVLEDAVSQAHAFLSTVPLSPRKTFLSAWRRDHELLSTSLSKGIIAKGYGDRMDLFSLMIIGSAGTPYEGGLFFFDLQLPSDYPQSPPQVFYHSMAAERINPNLYVEGRVCLSLLGTWNGKNTENWNPGVSNLLQVMVSLQGLILNSEPFFNEAGYDAIREKSDAPNLSRSYNEGVVASILQSMVHLVRHPIAVFKREIMTHFKDNIESYTKLLLTWVTFDESEVARIKSQNKDSLPEFPLVPVSKGFIISVQRHVKMLVEAVQRAQSELMKDDDDTGVLPEN